MATPVTSGASAFAYLNSTGSLSSGNAGTRQSASGSEFSDILSGQMRAKPASPTNSRSPNESGSTARTPERTTPPSPPTAEHTPGPENADQSAAAPERAHPDQPGSCAPAAPEAHGACTSKPAKHAARAASEAAATSAVLKGTTTAAAEAGALAKLQPKTPDLAAATAAAVEATAANTDAAATAAAVEATAANTDAAAAAAAPDAVASAAAAAPDAATAATNLAGLPAVIAALLPALAAKQASATGTALVSSDGVESAIGADAGAKMGLTGDTRGNSLQNPLVANIKAANPEPSAPTAQPLAAQADQLESSVSLADPLAREAPPAPVTGKAKDNTNTTLTTLQTLAAAQLQSKAEVPANLAERAAVPLAPAEDAQLGTQGSVMHTLRQTGQLPATPPQLPVATPAGQNGWANEVGNRVMWMVGRAESKAELVLTPPNLGKVEVSINLNGDQTTAQFVAATQSARDALEQAMPRLRELLAQSGISLGHTGVSTSSEQQTTGDERSRWGSGGKGAGDGIESGEAGSAAPWVRQTEGLVDTFA